MSDTIEQVQKSFEDMYNNAGAILCGGFIVALVFIGVAGYVWTKKRY